MRVAVFTKGVDFMEIRLNFSEKESTELRKITKTIYKDDSDDSLRMFCTNAVLDKIIENDETNETNENVDCDFS